LNSAAAHATPPKPQPPGGYCDANPRRAGDEPSTDDSPGSGRGLGDAGGDLGAAEAHHPDLLPGAAAVRRLGRRDPATRARGRVVGEERSGDAEPSCLQPGAA